MRPERALWTEQTKKERRSEVGKINGGDGDAYDELEELVGEEERELQWTEEAKGGFLENKAGVVGGRVGRDRKERIEGEASQGRAARHLAPPPSSSASSPSLC